jgi:predicted transcriptional regulator
MTKEIRLSRRDESMVDLLIRTGMSKNIAKTLVFLSKREETTSVEIEKATGLRQPEVSIAMQELRRRRWVEKRDIKKEGKGRPVHAYRLATPFEAIVDMIAREERAKIDDIETNIRKMRSQLT